MVKKKIRNVSRKNNSSFSFLNIVLFVLLLLAIVWIVSYPSLRKSSQLKGELGTFGLEGEDVYLGTCNPPTTMQNVACTLDYYASEPVFSEACHITIGPTPQNPKAPVHADGKIEKCICRYHDPEPTCEDKGGTTPLGSSTTATTGWCRETLEKELGHVVTTYGDGPNALQDCNARANYYCDERCPTQGPSPTEPDDIRCCME